MVIPNGTIIHTNKTPTAGNWSKGKILLGFASSSGAAGMAAAGCCAVLTEFDASALEVTFVSRPV